MTEPAAAAMTIDDLAQRSGLPSSTVRLYQTKGLLPAPRKVGRVGHYDDGHLARLELIGRLQERGFSLAAIADLVTGWEAGRSLDQVLGLEQRVVGASLGAEPPARVPVDELLDRFPPGQMSPDVLRRAAALGLVTLTDDGTVEIQSPTFLDVGATLAGLGVPVAEVLDEYEHLAAATADIAARFTELFERHVWAPFERAGLPAEEVGRMTAALAELGPLADRVVQAALHRALAAAAEQFLAEQAKRRA